VVVIAAAKEGLDHLGRRRTGDATDDSREGQGLLGQVRIVDDICTEEARELDVVFSWAFAGRRLTLELRAGWLPRICGDEDERAMGSGRRTRAAYER
jgi:hypothetical protein